ncbi:MAG TPA: response regulator [Candidatus Polarisedimenticolaceae bacterium]|nr:response regulator [Candidatus Polarisedimenticolaceae bacterium]
MTRVKDPYENDRGPAVQQHNGKTILLAEDDPFISRMYETKLANAGYHVVLVRNGRDAYDHIKSDNPDLIMLDISMPELSGFEVIKALQANGLDDLVQRIVVVTNSADPGNRAKARELGIDYMIKAELTPQDVLVRINEKLGVA